MSHLDGGGVGHLVVIRMSALVDLEREMRELGSMYLNKTRDINAHRDINVHHISLTMPFMSR